MIDIRHLVEEIVPLLKNRGNALHVGLAVLVNNDRAFLRIEELRSFVTVVLALLLDFKLELRCTHLIVEDAVCLRVIRIAAVVVAIETCEPEVNDRFRSVPPQNLTTHILRIDGAIGEVKVDLRVRPRQQVLTDFAALVLTRLRVVRNVLHQVEGVIADLAVFLVDHARAAKPLVLDEVCTAWDAEHLHALFCCGLAAADSITFL